MTLTLEDRIAGSPTGAAVGDALGGPVEGWTPEQISERHGGRVRGIAGPFRGDDRRTARPIAPHHKGDGHVTDDTLMTHALIRVYGTVRDHLTAYSVADHLVPDLIGTPRWIPELEAEALPPPVGPVNAANPAGAALSPAKDGTRTASEAVREVASRHTDFETAMRPLREAVAPYDTVGPDYRKPSPAARRPSRVHAIEELPIAPGMLLVGNGDFRHTVQGSVNYSRDCDWSKTVAEACRLDLLTPARELAEVTREVFAQDAERRRTHESAFAALAAR
ncbi:ADP-ribosylglycohydrolase family protein [Streptomyces sp. NPDC050738]|uniref:ADP-ribosylglycohydrolase family protein n=1 Tax=Streptomyces sp. NPDC050738 TaxID=3154744 RepID=UPI003448F1FA